VLAVIPLLYKSYDLDMKDGSERLTFSLFWAGGRHDVTLKLKIANA
jgi:hypothetical protein